MVVHIFLIGIHRVLQLGRLIVERVNHQTGLSHVDILRIAIHKQLEGSLRPTGQGILPVAIHLLQNLQMGFDRVTMGHRGVDIHIEEILQHGRLGAHHGVLVGPHLDFLLRLLVEIDSEKHDDQGDDEAHDERRPQDFMPRFLLGLLRLRNLRDLRHHGIRLRIDTLLGNRLGGRGIDTAMTVRTLAIVLEDIFSTVRTTGDLSCYLNPT